MQEASKTRTPGPAYPKHLSESSAFAGAVVVSGQNAKTWCPQTVGKIRLYFRF